LGFSLSHKHGPLELDFTHNTAVVTLHASLVSEQILVETGLYTVLRVISINIQSYRSSSGRQL
jgi:hypothetical protein